MRTPSCYCGTCQRCRNRVKMRRWRAKRDQAARAHLVGYVRLGEAADAVYWSRQRIWRAARDGEIDAQRVGRYWLVKLTSVQDWAKAKELS